MSDLKRKPSKKAPPKYPAAREALSHRREFLALLAKGALGAGVLGLIGCDGADDPYQIAGGLKAPDAVDIVDDAMSDVPVPGGIQAPDTQTWDSGGVAPLPDTQDVVEDKYQVAGDLPIPDVHDTYDWDGPAGVPPLPDTVDKDTCTVPTDVEDDFVPLPGEAPMPDVIEQEDVQEDSHDDVLSMKDFAAPGFAPYPEE